MQIIVIVFFFQMIRRPPRSTQGVSSAASDVYKRQTQSTWDAGQLEDELKEDSWLVTDVEQNDVMRDLSESSWFDFVKKAGTRYSVWKNFPENPAQTKNQPKKTKTTTKGKPKQNETREQKPKNHEKKTNTKKNTKKPQQLLTKKKKKKKKKKKSTLR
eukprot:TRINITY_DN10336_c0_g1_i1.p1 TRINITY_DN10336_c0_g1~~TRINITY_DN10336_c0_g1_i1.p1  ORF type:complete len:158 (+),score=60.38 TRINITY_DN10336_c0_g1_i1:85-558(+)